MSDRLQKVIAYHEATKHHFHAYAPGPGMLDWATQPDPFRRYAGCEVLPLYRFSDADGPGYEQSLMEGANATSVSRAPADVQDARMLRRPRMAESSLDPIGANRVAPAALGRESVSRLLYDSLALSAWKQAGHSCWALRVNPSSGNLHPTEGYLITGPVPGLLDTPAVCHYAPKIHALEVRTGFSLDAWRDLAADLPPQTLIMGLSSIYWREAWKYGSRAFRYCQHDTGHAIATVSFAAAALGWKASLLDDLGDEAIADLLGLAEAHGPEAERPECLLAVYPQTQSCNARGLPRPAIAAVARGGWCGTPNTLSPSHRAWPIIDDVDEATRKSDTVAAYVTPTTPAPVEPASIDESVLLRRLIHQRRSAVAMDGHTGLTSDGFFSILQRCMPGANRFPFNALPWSPSIQLLLFVHRVRDVPPGLYLLVRDPTKDTDLRAAFTREFDWVRPNDCPGGLPLYRLAAGDCRNLAGAVSCHQSIAADGVFAMAMLAEFEPALEGYGPWFYRRLYWECGVIGQLLYLEAQAYGIQATGIGCFFDDPVHEVLGLQDRNYQSLYHFTLGGGVEDTRLTSLAPYPEEAPLPPR
jgi:SagB-type dehydrogenase family enzyme